jgi:hypothetical protein
MSKTTPELNMADLAVTRRMLQVEHIRIETTKKFADVVAALEGNVPQLDRCSNQTAAFVLRRMT